MLTKELDVLIAEVVQRIEPTLKHSPDPIAAEFLGKVLSALREYREDRRWADTYGDVSRLRWEAP